VGHAQLSATATTAAAATTADVHLVPEQRQPTLKIVIASLFVVVTTSLILANQSFVL
jgi:hypothetical protein